MMPQTHRVGRHVIVRGLAAFVRASFIIALAGVVAGAPAIAQSPDDGGRVAASFLLARGRLPSPAEVQAWNGAVASLPDLLARHASEIERDPATQAAVAARARLDAFGSETGDQAAAPAAGRTYLDLMQAHLQQLAASPDAYARVLHRAYQLVLRRNAYAEELDYWKRQPTLSFALLAACVDDWARRNQPGLMVTAGPAAASVNSGYLATVRLSADAAAEARALVKLDPIRRAAPGRFVVAPGAGHVASVGGIHFAAAGAATLPVSPSVR